MAHLFLIDDDAFVLYTLRRILQKDGHTVDTFDNGRDALERLRVVTPDLVIADVVMPVLGGLQFLAEMRAFNSQTKVLMISGGSIDFSMDLVATATQSGANAVLMKPFDRTTLVNRIATLLPQGSVAS